jgi:hypothetical protein
MNLGELIEVAEIEKGAVIKDRRGDVVAEVDSKNGIPQYLNGVEINAIDFDSNGVVWIDLAFDSNLSFVSHMESKIRGLTRALSEEDRVADPEDVNAIIAVKAKEIEDECHKAVKALTEGKIWDYYLG